MILVALCFLQGYSGTNAILPEDHYLKFFLASSELLSSPLPSYSNSHRLCCTLWICFVSSRERTSMLCLCCVQNNHVLRKHVRLLLICPWSGTVGGYVRQTYRHLNQRIPKSKKTCWAGAVWYVLVAEDRTKDYKIRPGRQGHTTSVQSNLDVYCNVTTHQLRMLLFLT